MLDRLRDAGQAEALSDRDPLTEYGFDPPLDLVHLARQCCGDHELEDELLMLFRLQSRSLAAQLTGAVDASVESKAKIAHKLRGSALAIGARRVAEAALRIEDCASTAQDRGTPSAKDGAAMTLAIAALDATVSEAVAEIERIRG